MFGRGVNKKRVTIVLVVIIVVIVGIIIGIDSVFGPVSCESYSCFRTNMQKCSAATYINEGNEATWKYEILGPNGSECLISVELLQGKEGELGVEELEGLEMECAYPAGRAEYPEKDLSLCHGRLKEELQEIIIEKLHTVVIENLGIIDEGLNS